MKQLFAVVDVETTGGLGRCEKITEIAIFVTDGENLIRSFHSLVNPERTIPPYIINLTGITNEMVEQAPRFYEIAAKILETFKDTVFVAHNAVFDYNFIKKEFAELGYKFRMDTLCTVQLSKKIFPGLSSYSLGELCKSLGISIYDRHRAKADAEATMLLFNMIYKKDKIENDCLNINGFTISGLSKNIDLSKFKNLPDTTGVYYLYDDDGELIYIGKSKNIRNRVISHLRNEDNHKSFSMRTHIADVDFVETGSELIALILESNEIRKNKPRYNKMQRRTMFNWGIYMYEDSSGYLCLSVKKVSDTDEIFLNLFSSRDEANDALRKYCKKYQLCEKLCGLYKTAGACFYYPLGECYGACCGNESPEDYNKRVQLLVSEFNFGVDNVYILFENCLDSKTAVVKIHNGHFCGYGYFDSDDSVNLGNIDDFIEPMVENKDIKMIIRNYLKTKNDYKIIKVR